MYTVVTYFKFQLQSSIFMDAWMLTEKRNSDIYGHMLLLLLIFFGA